MLFRGVRASVLICLGGGGGRDCFPNVLVPFTFRSSQPLTEVKDSRKDAVHVNNKLLLGLELASYIHVGSI